MDNTTASTATNADVMKGTGRVAAVQGPVVDVRFPEDEEAPAAPKKTEKKA